VALELGLPGPEESSRSGWDGAGLGFLVTVGHHTSSSLTLRPASLCDSVPGARVRGVVQHNTIQAGAASFVRRTASSTSGRPSSSRNRERGGTSKALDSGIQPSIDYRVDCSIEHRLQCVVRVVNSRASTTLDNEVSCSSGMLMQPA